MKRHLTLLASVAVAVTVGFTVSRLTTPKAPAPPAAVMANPVAPTMPTDLPQIEPDPPTHAQAAVAAPNPSSNAPTPQYWYGPDRNEVGAAVEAELKRQREQPETPKGMKLQPLNVQ
jgi:hypothetical protein